MGKGSLFENSSITGLLSEYGSVAEALKAAQHHLLDCPSPASRLAAHTQERPGSWHRAAACSALVRPPKQRAPEGVRPPHGWPAAAWPLQGRCRLLAWLQNPALETPCLAHKPDLARQSCCAEPLLLQDPLRCSHATRDRAQGVVWPNKPCAGPDWLARRGSEGSSS